MAGWVLLHVKGRKKSVLREKLGIYVTNTLTIQQLLTLPSNKRKLPVVNNCASWASKDFECDVTNEFPSNSFMLLGTFFACKRYSSLLRIQLYRHIYFYFISFASITFIFSHNSDSASFLSPSALPVQKVFVSVQPLFLPSSTTHDHSKLFRT